MTSSHGRERLMVLATAASLVATALVPVAVADEDPRSPASLDVDVERNSGFTYQMSTQEEDIHRETTGRFDMDAFRLNLSYTSSNASAEIRSVNASLALEGVYEFRDVNENGRFDLGDRVVRFVQVDPGKWSRMDHVETKGELEILRAEAPLEGSGRVQLDVLLSPETINLSPDAKLRPLDNEVDVTIQGIQSTGQATKFSLAMRLESDRMDRTESQAVRVKGNGANFIYEWGDEATREGDPVPLNSTLVEQHVTRDGQAMTELLVVHAFEPEDPITLHNSFQVEEQDSQIRQVFSRILGDPLLYIGGLVAAVLVVGGRAWLKLREDDSGRTLRPSND